MNIGAAYVRVSTDSQEEYSPESQIKLIQDYAKRQGYVIPSDFIFRDDGISGKRADKRPAFQLMIAKAKESPPSFDTIFVWKYSRFARNQEESLVYKNMLKKNGVSVISISEPSSDSPYSSLIESIISWMDEYYLINLAQEVRRGMTEKARRGEAMGTAPFGYTCKDKTFVPNENAPIIQWVFEQYTNGKGASTIARELNAMGIKTRRGNPIDNRWVTYVLSNPAYIGKIRWSTEGHANYGRTYYKGENVLLVDGKHEPIIDITLWEKAQEKLAKRPTDRYSRKGSKTFMLKGLCRCGNCGATLTLSRDKYLQCHRYARGQCSVSHCLSIDKANEAVIAELEKGIKNQTYRFSPPKATRKHPKHDWDKLIASEEERLRRAKNALLDGVFTSDEYMTVKTEIDDTIKKLEDAKKEDEPTPVQPEKFESKVIGVLDVIKSPDVSEEAKNAALRTIIEKIVYRKPMKTLDIYFSL
jgi:DNA invertase Pin-like site-specific DNA recombinase